MKVPCELFVWYVLPGIRQELTRVMVDEFELSQAKVAEKLGVTEAAISQYHSEKRGKYLLFDGNILSEIKKSAERIIEGDELVTAKEVCRICNLIKKTDIVPKLYEKHTGKSVSIEICDI